MYEEINLIRFLLSFIGTADQSVKHAHIKGHQTFRKAQNPFSDFNTETQNLLLVFTRRHENSNYNTIDPTEILLS